MVHSLPLPALRAAPTGSEVVVIYNSRLPESKQVAEYYASRRAVPDAHVWGFDLPTSEAMSLAEFIDGLQKPLLKKLEEGKLWILSPPTNVLSEPQPGAGGFRRVMEAKVRYAALCYGVPVKILKDPALVEPGMERLRPEFRRNEAAVDSELANLPRFEMKAQLWIRD